MIKRIKLFFSGLFAAVLVAIMALSINLNAKSNNLSDVSLANVEALAQLEFDARPEDCFEYCTIDFDCNCYLYKFFESGNYFYIGTCKYSRAL